MKQFFFYFSFSTTHNFLKQQTDRDKLPSLKVFTKILKIINSQSVNYIPHYSETTNKFYTFKKLFKFVCSTVFIVIFLFFYIFCYPYFIYKYIYIFIKNFVFLNSIPATTTTTKTTNLYIRAINVMYKYNNYYYYNTTKPTTAVNIVTTTTTTITGAGAVCCYC